VLDSPRSALVALSDHMNDLMLLKAFNGKSHETGIKRRSEVLQCGAKFIIHLATQQHPTSKVIDQLTIGFVLFVSLIVVVVDVK